MAMHYAETVMTIRAETPLRDALRDLADQDGTNVSEFLRRELRALVASKGISLHAGDDKPRSAGRRR